MTDEANKPPASDDNPTRATKRNCESSMGQSSLGSENGHGAKAQSRCKVSARGQNDADMNKKFNVATHVLA